MLIAVLSDIHANREALEAVLAAIQELGSDRLVILGDLVGYGADPVWCTERCMELADRGAVILRGNHDQAVFDHTVQMNSAASLAMEWTRRQLGTEARAFLASLPLEVREEDRLYVHAEACAPEQWRYIQCKEDAAAHMSACDAHLSFCGHVHIPAIYVTGPSQKMIRFDPPDANPIPILPQRNWLAVMGSVGQPRDGNPAAAFGLLDTSTSQLRFMRAAYDVELAAEKIRAAGLPIQLAARLLDGH